MAVTFHDIPQKYAPSDNPVTYRFSSDQTAQANFSFLVETYINGAVVATDKVFPENGIYAHFDASTITRYIVPTPTISTVISQNSGTMNLIKVKVTEYYGTTPTAQATATSTETYTFKACLSNEAWISSDFETNYEAVQFLTNYPRAERVQVLRGQDVQLAMITNQSLLLTIRFYDSSDVLIDTYTDTQNYYIWQLNLKSSILDAIVLGGIAGVSYFIVDIDGQDSITFEYFDDYCNAPFSLLWMNEFGSYDTFVFKHNNALNASVSSESYGKQFGQWDGNSFVYAIQTSGTIDFSKSVKEKGELTSDYLTQLVQNWLVELYKSPFLLLYGVNTIGLPINIEGGSYQIIQERFEDLISESVRYSKSTEHRSLSI